MDLSNYGSLLSISSLSYFIANATSCFEVQKLNEQEYLDVLTFHIRERRNLVVELLCIASKACGCHKAAMQANCPLLLLLLLCKYKHQHKYKYKYEYKHKYMHCIKSLWLPQSCNAGKLSVVVVVVVQIQASAQV